MSTQDSCNFFGCINTLIYLNLKFASTVTGVVYQLDHTSVWVLDQWCLSCAYRWPPRVLDFQWPNCSAPAVPAPAFYPEDFINTFALNKMLVIVSELYFGGKIWIKMFEGHHANDFVELPTGPPLQGSGEKCSEAGVFVLAWESGLSEAFKLKWCFAKYFCPWHSQSDLANADQNQKLTSAVCVL